MADHRRRRARRGGYLMTELVVAAGILITVMTIVASVAPRLGRLWQQTAHQRTAAMELSNQLERLTRLPIEQLPAELENLQASRFAAAALPEPEVGGELIDDSLGARVVLRIRWQHRVAGQPVELVGWLHRQDDASAETSAEEDPS